MTKNIVIADAQGEYVERLVSYISKKYGEQYNIQAFTDKSQFKTYIQVNKCEILLLAPELYDAGVYLKNVKLPVILLESDEELVLPEKLKWSINKYTRISTLLAYLEREYEEVERNRPLIYGMYSPAGGVGKSTVAVAAALAYAKVGKNVLYLNLEDIDGTGMFFEDKPVAPAFLANFNKYQDRIDAVITKGIKQDSQTNIMYLERQFVSPDPIFKEQLPEFFERIIDNGIANIIIVEFNSSPECLDEQVLASLDYLTLVCDTHMHAVYKLKKWLSITQVDKRLDDKVKVVINQGREINIPTPIDVIGRIDKLYATNPLGLSEYIAQNQFLRLHGLF